MSASAAARQLREVRIGRIFDLIAEAAANDAPCPTNRALCHLIGVNSNATVSIMVDELEQQKLIRVNRMNDARTVEIVATGQRTAAPVRVKPVRRTLAGRSDPTALAALFDDVLADTGSIEQAGAAIGVQLPAAKTRFARIRKDLGWQAI